MLRHPGAVLLCLADEIKVNIDLGGLVLFGVPSGTLVYLNSLDKLPHQFRRSFRNICVLVHQLAEAVGVLKRVLPVCNLVFERFCLCLQLRLFQFIAFYQCLKLPVGEMSQNQLLEGTAEQRFQVFQPPSSLVQFPLLGRKLLFHSALVAAGKPLEQLVPMFPRLGRHPPNLAQHDMPQGRCFDGVGRAVLLMAVVLAADEGVLALVPAPAPAKVVP